MDEHDKTRRAEEKVDAMLGFYIHLAVFIGVLAILFVVNLLSSDGWWVQWPFILWGIGVIGHAYAVFRSGGPSFVTTWRLRKIKEVRDRM